MQTTHPGKASGTQKARLRVTGSDVKLVDVIYQEGTVNRERALRVVMVVVGLLFVAGIYPMAMTLWHPSPSDDLGDTMMLSLYFTLGVFLLVAARKPSAHRSLIAFAAWSSFAHAVVMSILGLHIPSEKTGFLIGSAVLVVIGVALLALAPAKQSVVSAADA
jgi:peptidoglycan/LPS O-acetylase OafA/YrhL